jgi:hypothetical protein
MGWCQNLIQELRPGEGNDTIREKVLLISHSRGQKRLKKFCGPAWCGSLMQGKSPFNGVGRSPLNNSIIINKPSKLG